ncbi:MAG: hypothetical protein K6U80_15600 [Firmicutes bacterium]|nr:hypothetical protein [Bacillota bacterium]
MVRTGLLYDFYGGLLTEKQRQAMEKYYLENWSLAEIASFDGVSRQAVHDLLHRSERMVQEYEAKLGLLDRFLKLQTALAGINGKIEAALQNSPADDSNYKVLREIQQEIARLIELA